jgi:hypothetical protein
MAISVNLRILSQARAQNNCVVVSGIRSCRGVPTLHVNAEATRILANAEFAHCLLRGGVEATRGTPNTMQRHIANKQKRRGVVIRGTGITAGVMRKVRRLSM